MSRFANLVRRSGALSLIVIACHSGTGPLATVQVSNQIDDFVFLGQSFERVATDSLHYVWAHTGTVANVARSIAQADGSSLNANIMSGTATLIIRDGAGAQVYSENLNTTTRDTTNTGAAGNWSVDLKLVQVKGDVLFELRKLR